VLSDAGLGFGAADALDWLIHHRNDTWGLTGADTSTRASTSPACRSAAPTTPTARRLVRRGQRRGARGHRRGGRDRQRRQHDWIASPCAADLAISVGAFTDDNTIAREDDIVADYSNEGPRLADGDASSSTR
jgi:hypothetical protein